MKILYILEARWHDKINRIRKNQIIGVFSDLEKLEQAKNKINAQPHEFKSVSFSVNSEVQPFHA